MENTNTFGSLMDYAVYVTDTFGRRPFGAEDGMVLSQLAYLRYDSVVTGPSMLSRSVQLSDAAAPEVIEKLLKNVSGKAKMQELLEALAINPRFYQTRIKYYLSRLDPEADKQFCAVSFFLDDGTVFIAIRGTDSTLTGWRENLKMAFEYPVPAQHEALQYAQSVMSMTGKRFRIGGHSKGGNLAVYAAMMLPERLQSRVLGVYNYDGPGFKDFVYSLPEYRMIADRVHKFIPTESVVGTLLQQDDNYLIVNSSQKSIQQHDMFSWLFYDGHLSYAQSLSRSAERFDLTLDRWLEQMSDERRREIIDIIFILLAKTGASNIMNLLEHFASGSRIFERELLALDAAKRKLLLSELASLGKAYLGAAVELQRKDKTDKR